MSGGLSGGVDIRLARQLGLHDLGLLSQISQAGSTAGAQVQLAALAIAGGLATTVVVVHADAPLKPAARSGDAYRRRPGSVRDRVRRARPSSPGRATPTAATPSPPSAT